MSKESIHDLYIFLEKTNDREERKRIREEIEVEEHILFLERTKCKECNMQMDEIGSWSKGEGIIGGRCYSTTLYQCQKCKTVRILQ